MKRLLILLICFSFILGGCSSNKSAKKDAQEITSSASNKDSTTNSVLSDGESKEVPPVAPNEFYTMATSSVRPIAVMIDNDSSKARPQIGLESAYLVYEIIIEGGATRFMALFKDYDIKKVGPVRSSRHYFLDYALENDAIYAHAGWSPLAQADIPKLGVNNINGLLGGDDKCFWRDNTYDKTYHNYYTSVKSLSERAENVKGYSVTADDILFDFNKNDNIPEGNDCTSVDFKYSNNYNVSFNYNSEKTVYERYINGQKHTSQTGDTLTAKNIIIYNVTNYDLNDGQNKGRQNLNNIGNGEGWYITLGKAQKITWSKSSRSGKTQYKTENGEELVLNPGITYIQIIPQGKSVNIK